MFRNFQVHISMRLQLLPHECRNSQTRRPLPILNNRTQLQCYGRHDRHIALANMTCSRLRNQSGCVFSTNPTATSLPLIVMAWNSDVCRIHHCVLTDK